MSIDWAFTLMSDMNTLLCEMSPVGIDRTEKHPKYASTNCQRGRLPIEQGDVGMAAGGLISV